MDAAYDPARWNDLAVMVGGATAALAGLLVVSVSINVREILAEAGLPTRAAGALTMVTTPLLLALVLLIPGQSNTALGIELLIFGLLIGVVLTRLNWPHLSPERTFTEWAYGTGLWTALIIVPTILGAVGLLSASIGGLYWIPVAMAAGIIGGLLGAWVLLVEILR